MTSFTEKAVCLNLRSVLAAAIVLFGALSASAQWEVPNINPYYNPSTPDYVEAEVCSEITNNQSLNPDSPFPGDGGCAELIPAPVPGNTFHLRGKVDSVSHGFVMDIYKFQISEPTEINLSLRASHDLLLVAAIFSEVSDEYMDCGLGSLEETGNALAAMNSVGPNLDVSNSILPAGNCVLIVMANFWQDEDGEYLPCGLIEYEVQIEQVGGSGPGDLCELAIAVDPEDTFNESRVSDDASNGFYFGGFGCAASDIGQHDRWYKFTAEKTTSFVSARREGSGNFNPAIEIYDACGGPAVLCQNNDPGAQELVIFPTTIGHEYYFRVYHAGPQALTNTAISAAVAHIPSTQLRALDCGRMDLTPADIIRSDWPSNSYLLVNWEFEFTLQEPPYTEYNIISPNGHNPQFRMHWFPQLQPGKQYAVRTRPRMYQGPTWGDFAGTCTIGTAPTFHGMAALQPSDAYAGDTGLDRFGNLNLWPNPASGEVTVGFSTSREDRTMDLTVFDLSGKQVDRITTGIASGAVNNYVYDLSRLAPGLYMVHVSTETGTAVKKLSVKR